MSDVQNRNNTDNEIELRDWIRKHKGTDPLKQSGIAPAPYGGRKKAFMLTTMPLEELNFTDNRFNPRTPNTGKVNELIASISSLTLLTPLTCAYIGKEYGDNNLTDEEHHDEVVLLDGRHRFSALDRLRKDYPDWAKEAKIDLKIYFNLQLSDIYMLATYLNKTRKSLAKGEYYKFVVNIYEERETEIVRAEGKTPTEERVFKDISTRELMDKYFDLSVGRIVGITAFDDEEGTSWYPMVGIRQQDKIKEDGISKGKYCPITAGNMATFLGHLCSREPYPDHGETRATEITNVLRLGEKFREKILQPVDDFDLATGTTVSCKHWTLDAFGSLIEEFWADYLVKKRIAELPLLAHTELRWDRIKQLLDSYYDIMSSQAPVINKYRGLLKAEKLDEAAPLREYVWSYQTQTGQITPKLKSEIESRIDDWLRK